MNRLNRRKERLLNEIAERVSQKLLKEESGMLDEKITVTIEATISENGREIYREEDLGLGLNDWPFIERFLRTELDSTHAEFGEENSVNGYMAFYYEDDTVNGPIGWISIGYPAGDLNVYDIISEKRGDRQEEFTADTVDEMIDIVQREFEIMKDTYQDYI